MTAKGTSPLDRAEQILAELAANAKKEAKKNDRRGGRE